MEVLSLCVKKLCSQKKKNKINMVSHMVKVIKAMTLGLFFSQGLTTHAHREGEDQSIFVSKVFIVRSSTINY